MTNCTAYQVPPVVNWKAASRRPAESVRNQWFATVSASVFRFSTFALVRGLHTQAWTDADDPVGCSGQPIPKQRRTNVKILMVLTSHGQLGNTGLRTDLWLE